MHFNLKLTLGCDPELFLVDPTGKHRSAVHRIGGSKHAPLPLSVLGNGYAVQEDNVAMEFNIPPASSAKEFSDSVMKTVKFLTDGVRSEFDFSISTLSAVLFDPDELTTPQSREFGCEPDYNAWTGKVNPRPAAADPHLRSCGGHIHIGYDKTLAKSDSVIRCMDLFTGVPSVLMDRGEMRKELYGKAGANREKQYGVEYRTLSNFWVINNLGEWAFRNTEKAVRAAVAQFPVEEDEALILQAINGNNKDIAMHLVQKHNLEVLHV